MSTPPMDSTTPSSRCSSKASVPANELYVVVEIDGYLYLMRGAVFSYREFKRPIDEQRMTDEEWQQYLQQYPETGKPSWMKEIIIPSGEKPVPNERIFYGTGC